MKGSNPRCNLGHSQNKGLSKYQRRASGLCTSPYLPPEAERRVCGSQSWKARGNLGPRDQHPPPNCEQAPPVANHVFLGSRRVEAWDQLPRGDTRHTRDSTLTVHPRNEQPGPGTWLTHRIHLGQCSLIEPCHLSCSDLGRAQNTHPTESVPLWNTWELEPEQLRSRKCMKHRTHIGQYPWRATWSLSSVDPESTCLHEWGQTNCGPYTMSTPHTQQWYLLAVSLPPHNTTEQVSLNKWPPFPPCVRVEITHWRDLQTEEAKIKKRELLCKWQVQWIKTLLLMLTKHWKGNIDPEKNKLEQGTIWNWTDPTLPSTNSSREIPKYIFTVIIFNFF